MGDDADARPRSAFARHGAGCGGGPGGAPVSQTEGEVSSWGETAVRWARAIQTSHNRVPWIQRSHKRRKAAQRPKLLALAHKMRCSQKLQKLAQLLGPRWPRAPC